MRAEMNERSHARDAPARVFARVSVSVRGLLPGPDRRLVLSGQACGGEYDLVHPTYH